MESDNGAFMEKFILEASSSSPHELALKGLTFAVKDIFDLDGYVTGFGNPDWARTHSAATSTAPAVLAVLREGATCIGKTVMDEMAYSINGENKHYGTPKNPCAPDRVPGGSSSGSAVAVAAMLVDFSLGTDTGGSVRVPASFCGILGFRPSHGVVSTTGVIPMAQSFDTVGWFARDAEILNRVGRVLLQLPIVEPVKPSHIIIPEDCFQLLSIPSDRVTTVLVKSVEKLFGDNDNKLKLHFKDMDLEFSWPVGRIKAALSKIGSNDSSSPKSCSPETIKLIATLVEEHNIPEANITLAAGVSAFLWLYTSIQGYKPAKVVITSELPLSSGLGSSSALCVSLCAALLALSDSVNLDCSHQGWLMFGENELDLVNKWAFEGEKIIHGKPSGIDNTVSTYGNMIKFRSGELTRLRSNMPLKMLITNTKVGRNTKALVASVSERTFRHPIAMASVFKAVDSISNEVATIIQSPAHDDIAITEKEDKLEELMEMNQGLLQCMGVSHASIETVLRTTLKFKLASKLTGAGGGGCVLTLLPTLLSGTVVDKVIAELEACGFQCLIAGIGGKGVQICFDSLS